MRLTDYHGVVRRFAPSAAAASARRRSGTERAEGAKTLRMGTVGLRLLGLALVVVLGVVPTVASASAPAGTVTEFSTGITAGSEPLGITAGPEGNLWFTELQGGRIARITPTGTVTEFPGLDHAPVIAPEEITVGPDGNLWFTDLFFGRIGRTPPTDFITQFEAGINDSEASLCSLGCAIAAGPDGNLWFTEAEGNKIGRITPTGKVTEFPIPTADSFPTGITAGPDGNLWFTESKATRSGGSPRRAKLPSSRPDHGRKRTERNHSRPGREPMVHRVRRQDRTDNPDRHGHRVLDRDHSWQRTGQDRGGPGRQPMVHRA